MSLSINSFIEKLCLRDGSVLGQALPVGKHVLHKPLGHSTSVGAGPPHLTPATPSVGQRSGESPENSVLTPAGKWRLYGLVQELQQRRRTASPWPSAPPQSSLQGSGASGSMPQARAHQHCDHTVRPASAGSSRASARPAHTRTDSSEETEAHREAKLCPWSCHQGRRASLGHPAACTLGLGVCQGSSAWSGGQQHRRWASARLPSPCAPLAGCQRPGHVQSAGCSPGPAFSMTDPFVSKTRSFVFYKYALNFSGWPLPGVKYFSKF